MFRQTLKEVDMTVNEIRRSLERFQIQKLILPNRPDRQHRDYAKDNNYLLLKVAIFGAFYPNYFSRTHGNMDMREACRTLNGHDPMTSLYFAGFPQEQNQYGDIYAEQVKSLFSEFQVNRDLINVEFDASKVIVTFAKPSSITKINVGEDDVTDAYFRKNLTLNIIHQVYVAMKIKMLHVDYRTMHLFLSGEAAKKLKKLHETRGRLESENSSFAREATDAFAIGQVDPPDLEHKVFKMDIMHVNNPNSFWIMYADGNHTEMFGDVVQGCSTWMAYAEAKDLPKAKTFKVSNPV